ncbi:MAG TPA: DUF167 domain-containing protein [Acidimicrobiia bacterium]|nr:DUF167 domain-containing protein [Acidimicrobiia bacterium]
MRALRVSVKPNAPTATLTESDDGTWRATVKAPPVDGKANRELCRLVAHHFGLRPSQVTIKSGAGGRVKTIVIDDG